MEKSSFYNFQRITTSDNGHQQAIFDGLFGEMSMEIFAIKGMCC